MLGRERVDLLSALLGTMEPERRALVMAFELDKLPMTDAAALFGISLNTAWNRLRLGREDLRAAWRKIGTKGRKS